MIYIPLVLFEVRMSPQLSSKVYGIFPHSFLQHIRYGGYRPIVFMNHGLMVSLWMAAATVAVFWLWRSKRQKKVAGIPIAWATIAIIISTVLCKSANGWIYTSVGIACFYYYRRKKSTSLFRLLLLLIPLYITFRLLDIISIEELQLYAGKLFDTQRIESLTTRLIQEQLFGARAMERSIFGWGGYGRGWPVDPYTGAKLIDLIDSLWVIFLSTNGFVGLISAFGALAIGPWRIFTFYRKPSSKNRIDDQESSRIYAVVLSLIVSFFLLDSLLNAMVSPIYILCAGGLTSFYIHETGQQGDARPMASPE
jgi:O-antigen ligase